MYGIILINFHVKKNNVKMRFGLYSLINCTLLLSKLSNFLKMCYFRNYDISMKEFLMKYEYRDLFLTLT